MVDRFIVQPNTTEEDVVDWIKSFGSGKKSINLFQTTRDLMFGEAGNFYILLARNAEAEEITGIAINSWNQHAFSFKYDTSFSYSKLTTNADLDTWVMQSFANNQTIAAKHWFAVDTGVVIPSGKTYKVGVVVYTGNPFVFPMNVYMDGSNRHVMAELSNISDSQVTVHFATVRVCYGN